MSESSPPTDPEVEQMDPAEEVGDPVEGPLTGMRTDPEVPEELPEQGADPSDRSGLHDRAGDTQDFS